MLGPIVSIDKVFGLQNNGFGHLRIATWSGTNVYIFSIQLIFRKSVSIYLP